MAGVRRILLLGLASLASCQLPPQYVTGSPIDLENAQPADLSASPDLTPARLLADLSLADLTPPSLTGNTLPSDGDPTTALRFYVTDRDTGMPIPARVIFRPPPAAGFADSVVTGMFDIGSPGSNTGAVVAPGVVGSPEGVLLATGLGLVPVPPGTYELFITRGPEYEAVDTRVAIESGEVLRIDAQLDRTVDTRGWLSADLHVHTKSSFDSSMPLDRRVISMVSNGVEVIVSTEHNNANDLAPTIAQLGYGADVVGTVVGDEFNFEPGHGGAYPVAFDATLPAGGVPEWTSGDCVPGIGVQCTLAPQMFDIMHAQVPGVTVVTINHPWWQGGDLGYFTNIGWGAGTANPPPAPLETAGQFDAMEVLNGYWVDLDAVGNLITDWMFLLSQGYRVSALGSSDTHKINWVRAGWPRSWLRLPTDQPGEVTGQLLADAIRWQRVVASTGPFAELTVDGHPIGEMVVPKGGNVTVEMSVDAPNWMQVDVVRLYKDGVLEHEYAVPPGHRPVFHTTIKEPVTGDGWYVLQAEGATPLPGDVVGELSHLNGYEMQPFVITNPVFIDGDGDGRWRPPAWSGPPMPFARAADPGERARDRHGPVSEGCSPNETEPPLDAAGAAARYLAPLVHQ